MGKLSRTKGHAWEREVAARLREATGQRAERNLEEVRHGNRGDISTDLPLTVQCKVGKRPNLRGALREAVEANGEGRHPVAAVKFNAPAAFQPSEEVVLMRLDFFLWLIQQAWGEL